VKCVREFLESANEDHPDELEIPEPVAAMGATIVRVFAVDK
jgi:hypothetical protein